MDINPDPPRKREPLTLAIDIGGTRLKAGLLDAKGTMVAGPNRVNTPAAPSPSGRASTHCRSRGSAWRVRPHLGRVPRCCARRKRAHRAQPRHPGLAQLPAWPPHLRTSSASRSEC